MRNIHVSFVIFIAVGSVCSCMAVIIWGIHQCPSGDGRYAPASRVCVVMNSSMRGRASVMAGSDKIYLLASCRLAALFTCCFMYLSNRGDHEVCEHVYIHCRCPPWSYWDGSMTSCCLTLVSGRETSANYTAEPRNSEAWASIPAGCIAVAANDGQLDVLYMYTII